jgi:alkylation response protein AidB-like acyl-CoA dehydrogenase
MRLDYFLSTEQSLVRDVVRDFARKEVAPQAGAIDAEEYFPHELMRRLGELGLLGLLLPEADGGSGADMVSQALVQEELAYASGSVANAQVGAIEESLFLHLHGSAELRARYLPGILGGELKACFALTEPQAGSDPSNITTRARRVGDDYVVTGAKAWVTSGSVADIVIVITLTETDGQSVPTAILVPTDLEGVHRGRAEDQHGVRGLGTCGMTFDDVRVPASHRLGKEGDGLRMSLSTIDLGRISTAAMAVGLGQRALDEALRYTQERQQFGRPIFKFQGIQFQLAEMSTGLDAARLLYLHAARLHDVVHTGYTRAASEAKLYASETASRVCDLAMTIFGAAGYVKENPVERCLRDVRVCQIFEGTSNVQRLVIARELAKEAGPSSEWQAA